MAAPTPTLRAAILSYSQELVADASAHFFFWSQDIYTNCLLQLRILVGGGVPTRRLSFARKGTFLRRNQDAAAEHISS